MLDQAIIYVFFITFLEYELNATAEVVISSAYWGLSSLLCNKKFLKNFLSVYADNSGLYRGG